MRRISAVLLTFIMILSLLAVPTAVSAETYTINAPYDVTKTNGTVAEGTDHHDEAGQVYGANFNTVRNLSGKDHLALHSGDWARYDVSGFGAGKYNVNMTYLPGYLRGDGKSYPSTVTFELDGSVVLSKLLPFNSAEQTTALGEITLGKNSKYLIVKIATDSTAAQYISVITFEKVVEPNFVSYTALGKDGDVVSRGADKFELLMETDINPQSATSTTVAIKDENGDALDAVVSASGKTITVKLKETLDYGSPYTIYINGVTSTQGVALSTPVAKPFETCDKANDSGEARIEVTSYTKDGNEITAEGKLYSSCNLGIKGREVVLSDILDENSQLLNETKVTTGTDGLFTVSYTMDENSPAGKHKIQISSDYVVTPYENYAFYLSEEIAIDIKEDLSGLETIEDAVIEVEKYIGYMDIDMIEADRMIDDFDKVYEKILNKEFASSDDAMDCFREALYFEMVTQSNDADDIKAVLDNEQKAANIKGFDTELWNLLDDGNKSSVANDIIDVAAMDTAALANVLNEKVNALILNQYGYSAAVTFTSATVSSGNDVEIAVNSAAAVNDVYGIHLEISYENSAKALFEKDGILVDSDEFDVSINKGDNVLLVDLTAKGVPVSVSGELFTIKIPTNGKSAGTHSATVSGYVLYHPDEIESQDKHVKVNVTVQNNISVTVTEVTSFEKYCNQVIEGGEGVAYHDSAAAGTLEGAGSSAPNTVVMRIGEWQAYDISALSAGIYELSFEGGISYSGVAFTVSVDESVQIANKSVAPTGGYLTFKTAILGKITLDGEQKILKFLMNGTQPTYANKLTLTKVNPLVAEGLSSNTGITAGKTSQGADSFTVAFNNVLSESGFEVVIKDTEGKNIACQASTSDKNVVIDLKESLDYNKNYTITIKNLSDVYDQTVAEYTTTFETSGEDVLTGSGAVVIESAKTENNKLVVSGSVLSSKEVGIKGRKVKISVKSKEDADYVLRGESVSLADGAFEITVDYRDVDSGKIEVLAEAEYATEAANEIVYYYPQTTSEQIATAFSNLASNDAVLEKLRQNESTLGITLSDYSAYISEIADGMKNKTYESGEEVLKEINARFAMEKLNDAASADALLSFIDGDELNQIGKIQKDKWDLLENFEQSEVATAIYNMEDFEEPLDVIDAIDKEINKIIAERNSLEGAVVSATSPSVTVGQAAELNFSLLEKQENVKKITIKISYNESQTLFSDGGTIVLSEKLDDFVAEIKKEKHKNIYVISSQTPVSISGDLFTVSYLAKDGTAGTYNPVVEGNITYYIPEDIKGLDADVPFTLEAAPSITVSAQNLSDDVPTGGGNGYVKPSGGAPAGGVTGGNDEVKIPTTTDVKIIFTDIEHVAWAKDSINTLAKAGIISGRGDGTFAPDDNVTRAEFCKMISLAFGIYEEGNECDFNDVRKDAWYYGYIASAKAHGLVNGREDGSFGAEDTITREEMAAIAVRAIKATSETTEKFADDKDISSFAKEAVYTLKALGVMDGVGDNNFAPKTSVTRAMAAKVINMLRAV